jgi:hypothetical protein
MFFTASIALPMSDNVGQNEKEWFLMREVSLAFFIFLLCDQ